MPRVHLEILRGPYRPALASGLQVESCRLLTDLSLKCSAGWTPFRPGIVDTGAPLSLFPKRVWEPAITQNLGPIRVGGLKRTPECMFDVTLAIITLCIRDRLSQIGPIETHALLAHTDDVPTLIGMRGVLTDVHLHTNIIGDEAYLEIV